MLGLLLLATAQSAVPSNVYRPAPFPWVESVQKLECSVLTYRLERDDFTLSIMNMPTSDFVVVQGSEVLGLDAVVTKSESKPPIQRGRALMRRLNFVAGNDETVFVRQLFEEGDVRSTHVVVGMKAESDRTMGREQASGFCLQVEPNWDENQ